jgi:nucleotide-binding universal stress UspA family protein
MQEIWQNDNANESLLRAANPRHVRLWCAPEVILIVTNAADERMLLLEAVRQAKRSSAKILLAYVARPVGPRIPCSHGGKTVRSQSPAHYAQITLDRMVRQLRWAGISSEAVLLQGLPAEEIPELVRLRGANRVIVTTQPDPNVRGIASRAITEQILPRVSVPVCVLGSAARQAPVFTAPNGKVVLMLTPHMHAELLLQFACRYAEEHSASLSVVYVEAPDLPGTELSTEVNPGTGRGLRLLREMQMRFPLEVLIRQGHPVDETLALLQRRTPDCLILGLQTRASDTANEDEMPTIQRLIEGSLCPVMVLGNGIAQSGTRSTSMRAGSEEPRGNTLRADSLAESIGPSTSDLWQTQNRAARRA